MHTWSGLVPGPAPAEGRCPERGDLLRIGAIDCKALNANVHAADSYRSAQACPPNMTRTGSRRIHYIAAMRVFSSGTEYPGGPGRDEQLMTGVPPFPPDRLVTLANWQDPPFNRWAFQHIRELIPTARISRGDGPPAALRPAGRDVSGLRFRSGDRELTVAGMLAETWTDGFLVLHRGQIVTEQYFNGMRPDTPHLLMSVSKSVVSAVAGVLAGQGRARRVRTRRDNRAGTGGHLVRGRDRAASAGHAGGHAVRRVLRQPGGGRADLRARLPVAAGRRGAARRRRAGVLRDAVQ